LKNREESEALVESQKDCVLTKAEFEELPNRALFKGLSTDGRMLLIVHRPDPDKIQRLVTASLSEVRKVFDRLQ
jgi:protein-L-isoaspartate O-methyltransferase